MTARGVSTPASVTSASSLVTGAGTPTTRSTERRPTGGLSAPRLGEHFAIHGRVGEPYLRCGEPLRRVSFKSYDLIYYICETGGTVLADRRMSRVLR